MTRSDRCRPDVISSRSVKPVGTPVDQLLARVQLLDGVKAALGEIAERDEAVADFVVGDREDGVLGLVEDDVGVLLGFVGGRDDLVGGENQAAEGRLFLDDPRVVLDVGRVGARRRPAPRCRPVRRRCRGRRIARARPSE